MLAKTNAKVKEPARLRAKELSNGNNILCLYFCRDGRRYCEYLEMYQVSETDNNAKMQNQAILDAANLIK